MTSTSLPSGCLAKDLMRGSLIEWCTTTIALTSDSIILAASLLNEGLSSSMGPTSSHRTTCALERARPSILGAASSRPFRFTLYLPTRGPWPATSASGVRSPVAKSTSSNPLRKGPSLISLV